MDEEKTQVKPPTIGNLGRSAFSRMGGWLFVVLALGLMILPFISAFNDVLTRLIISLRGYRVISEVIVPAQVKWVVVILRLWQIPASAAGEYIVVDKADQPLLVEVIWNCVGWQSMLTFLLTVAIGFQAKYSISSKTRVLIVGIIGTILLNVLRIAVVIALFSWVSPVIAEVFHNYGALVTNTGWLFGFWWFAYEFMLEEKTVSKSK